MFYSYRSEILGNYKSLLVLYLVVVERPSYSYLGARLATASNPLIA